MGGSGGGEKRTLFQKDMSILRASFFLFLRPEYVHLIPPMILLFFDLIRMCLCDKTGVMYIQVVTSVVSETYCRY